MGDTHSSLQPVRLVLKTRAELMRAKLIIATFGLLAITGVVADSRKVEAYPWCVIDGRTLWIRTIIQYETTTAKGSEANEPPRTSRDYWAIECELATGNCKASSLSLRSLEEGKPIGLWDVTQSDGMRLVSVAGKIATIVWGFGTFTLDMSKKLVSYRYSDDASDSLGSGPCGP